MATRMIHRSTNDTRYARQELHSEVRQFQDAIDQLGPEQAERATQRIREERYRAQHVAQQQRSARFAPGYANALIELMLIKHPEIAASMAERCRDDATSHARDLADQIAGGNASASELEMYTKHLAQATKAALYFGAHIPEGQAVTGETDRLDRKSARLRRFEQAGDIQGLNDDDLTIGTDR